MCVSHTVLQKAKKESYYYGCQLSPRTLQSCWLEERSSNLHLLWQFVQAKSLSQLPPLFRLEDIPKLVYLQSGGGLRCLRRGLPIAFFFSRYTHPVARIERSPSSFLCHSLHSSAPNQTMTIRSPAGDRISPLL